MGKIKVYPFFSYLILVFFLSKSAVLGQDYYFDLEDDSTPIYYQETFSAQELLETNFDYNISNDIDVDICKSSKYELSSLIDIITVSSYSGGPSRAGSIYESNILYP